MRIDLFTEEPVFLVTLSRRNLLALLTKLGDEDSERTLISSNVYCNGEGFDGLVLVVRAEPDELHYQREQPPGPMSPRTEADIRELPEPPG